MGGTPLDELMKRTAGVYFWLTFCVKELAVSTWNRYGHVAGGSAACCLLPAACCLRISHDRQAALPNSDVFSRRACPSPV